MWKLHVILSFLNDPGLLAAYFMEDIILISTTGRLSACFITEEYFATDVKEATLYVKIEFCTP